MSSNELIQVCTVNTNIMDSIDQDNFSGETPHSNYAALARLAIGSPATLVPYAGTEGMSDLPDVRPKPNPWIADMLA